MFGLPEVRFLSPWLIYQNLSSRASLEKPFPHLFRFFKAANLEYPPFTA